MKTKAFSVDPQTLESCNDIMRRSTGNQQDGIIATFAAKFDENIDSDIKTIGVPNDDEQGNSYVDGVLFDRGSEVALLVTSDTLDGESVFRDLRREYCV